MQHEPALWLDRPALVHRAVWYPVSRNLKLLEQSVEAEPRHNSSDANAERAVSIMVTHRDHRPFKTGITDARHGEQNLARKISRIIHRVIVTLAFARVSTDM